MSLILHYIREMLSAMIILFPIYCVGRYLYLRKKKQTSSACKELTLGLFALYLIGLASQTIIPRFDMGIYTSTGQFYFDIYVGIDLSRVNLVPFKTIYSQLFVENPLVDDWSSVTLLNLMANVFLFVPIGIFFPLLYKRYRTIKKVLYLGLLSTCLVEFIQLFIGRSVDVDDILLNTMGVLLGYGAFILASKLKLVQTLFTNLKPNENE